MFCSFDATFRMQEIHQHIIEWSRTAFHDDNLPQPLQATDLFKTLGTTLAASAEDYRQHVEYGLDTNSGPISKPASMTAR